MRLKRILLCFAAVLLLLPAAASAAAPPIGGLTQLPGTLGCFSADGSSQDGTGTCQVGRGISAPESATVSPDGKFVYVGNYAPFASETGLTVFSRDPATGQLTQLPGTEGCLTADGSSQAGPNTCTKVEGIGPGDGRDLAITSDGKWAYMVNQGEAAPASIVIFQRNPGTGVLTALPGQAGCVSVNGAGQDGPGMCQTLSTLGIPNGIALSADDKYVYVTDYGSQAVHVLARNPATGALSEIQCLSQESSPPMGCAAGGRSLGYAQSLILTPDGMHAYSADGAAGISIFDRDPATGMLTQKPGAAGCISYNGDDNLGNPTCGTGRGVNGTYAMSISPSGQTLYVASYTDNGIAVFHVNPDGSLSQLPGAQGCTSLTGNDSDSQPTCTVGRALGHVYGSAISPDGQTLYVTQEPTTTEGGVAIFSLNPSTGAATQLPGLAGCLTADGASNGVPGLCGVARAVAYTYTPTVSPDGTSVYLASINGHSVSAFTRETGPTCSATNASTAYQAPVSVTLSCTDADGDPLTTSIATEPAHGALGEIAQSTGTLTYTPAAGYSGTDRFTFNATDGTNTSAPATATIMVGAPPTPPIVPGPSVQPPPPAAPIAHITTASQSHRKWHEGRHGGTTFSFTLNQAARVTFTFTVTQKHHQRTLGKLTITGHRGKNKLAFDGIINRHTKLKPGTYTVTITSGAGTPRRLTFTILK